MTKKNSVLHPTYIVSGSVLSMYFVYSRRGRLAQFSHEFESPENCKICRSPTMGWNRGYRLDWKPENLHAAVLVHLIKFYEYPFFITFSNHGFLAMKSPCSSPRITGTFVETMSQQAWGEVIAVRSKNWSKKNMGFVFWGLMMGIIFFGIYM